MRGARWAMPTIGIFCQRHGDPGAVMLSIDIGHELWLGDPSAEVEACTTPASGGEIRHYMRKAGIAQALTFGIARSNRIANLRYVRVLRARPGSNYEPAVSSGETLM